jgi:hypothetical protein
LAPLSNAVIPAKALATESLLLGDAEIDPAAGINTSIRFLLDAVVTCYALPDGGGRIYHMRHRDTVWADELFEAYQREANGTVKPLFERKPLKGVSYTCLRC